MFGFTVALKCTKQHGLDLERPPDPEALCMRWLSSTLGSSPCRCMRSSGSSSPRWHSWRDLGEAHLSDWVKAEEWLCSTRARGVQHRAPACGLWSSVSISEGSRAHLPVHNAPGQEGWLCAPGGGRACPGALRQALSLEISVLGLRGRCFPGTGWLWPCSVARASQ